MLRTVKRAKKGIYTTVKLYKKTAKHDLDEPAFMAWFFTLKLVASVSLKAIKHAIQKGRPPKFSFIKKHAMRAASYFAVLPVVLVALIQLIQMFSPSYLNYIKYLLVLYWVVSTIYKEVVVGKQKKKKSKSDSADQLSKPIKRTSSSKLSQVKVVKKETCVNKLTRRVTPFVITLLGFAERVSELVRITDFIVLLVGMMAYEALCAADVSQDMELALRQAVIMTGYQLLYSLSTQECAQEAIQSFRSRLSSILT